MSEFVKGRPLPEGQYQIKNDRGDVIAEISYDEPVPFLKMVADLHHMAVVARL